MYSLFADIQVVVLQMLKYQTIVRTGTVITQMYAADYAL